MKRQFAGFFRKWEQKCIHLQSVFNNPANIAKGSLQILAPLTQISINDNFQDNIVKLQMNEF